MNNGLTTLRDLFIETFRVFGEKFMENIPYFFVGIIFFLLGWLLARLVGRGVEKLLRSLKFDILAEKVKATQVLQAANIRYAPSAIIGRFAYWVIVLLVFVSVSEALGWRRLSYELARVLDYWPNFVSALLFFIVGTYIASFIRDFIKGATLSLGISTGKIISSFIFYLLFIIITLTALKQGGIETSIITSNLFIIMGSVMLSIAISYGFASRNVLENILASFFTKRNFHKGQIIEVDGVRGVITEINNIAVTLQTSDSEKVVIPSNQLLKTKVKIIKHQL